MKTFDIILGVSSLFIVVGAGLSSGLSGAGFALVFLGVFGLVMSPLIIEARK